MTQEQLDELKDSVVRAGLCQAAGKKLWEAKMAIEEASKSEYLFAKKHIAEARAFLDDAEQLLKEAGKI